MDKNTSELDILLEPLTQQIVRKNLNTQIAQNDVKNKKYLFNENIEKIINDQMVSPKL